MSARNFYIMPSALGPMQDDLHCYTPLANHETEIHVLPLVLASDYDALAAELEQEKKRRRAIDDEAFNYSEQVGELKAKLEDWEADANLLEAERDTFRADSQRLRDALTPELIDWIKCGLATNGKLVVGSHPALDKLQAALTTANEVT
jgi:hypothetical protein